MRKLALLFIQVLLVYMAPQYLCAQETAQKELPVLQSLRYGNQNLYALATENSAYKSIAGYNLDKGKRNLNSSNTYIREATATDARWRLISNSMVLAATTYGALLPIAIKGTESREITFPFYTSMYLSTIVVSGAVPFVLTMDSKVKRGPVVAFTGMGSLAFINSPFLYATINGVSIVNNIRKANSVGDQAKVDDIVRDAKDGLVLTMAVTTIAASTGAYFGAKALDIGPGEAALITSNGRWMMIEGGIIIGAFATYYGLPLINDIIKFRSNLSTLDERAFSPEQAAKNRALLGNSIEDILTDPDKAKNLGLPEKLVDRAYGLAGTLIATPAVLVGSSLLGCGAGYWATRNQSFTEGDVKIFNNMVSMSHITFAAILSAAGMYKYTSVEKALAIQAFAYPAGAFLNQYLFGKYDFSYNQSRLINIETQLFGLLGGVVGYLVFPSDNKITGALIGTALGANAGFATYFLGTKKRIGRANYSYIGESNMGFALLPSGSNNATISPGLKLSFSIR